jgi:hypothetical protein
VAVRRVGFAAPRDVARNFKDTNTDPERMARRLDSMQCNTPWADRIIYEQQDIFA